MKTGIWGSLFLFLALIPGRMHGQPNFKVQEDSLDYFFRQQQWQRYFEKVGVLVRIAADTMRDETKLDQAGNYLLRSFDSLTPEDQLQLRLAAMYTAHRYKGKFANFNKALRFYLIAHQYVSDPVFLDEWSWYIEHEIYNIYTRRNDFERAEYFATLYEQSLRQWMAIEPDSAKHINRLSRFYTNRGIQRRSEGKGAESFLYFQRGYHLADSIQFLIGIHSNAIGLAEYYIDSNNLITANNFLHVAENSLSAFTSKKDYNERSAELSFQQGRLIFKQGSTENDLEAVMHSLRFFHSAIEKLNEAYPNQKRREFAKYLGPMAEAYFFLNLLDQALDTINKGLSHIIADYTTYENLPDPGQIYYENSFVDLFSLQSRIFRQQYNTTGDIGKLEKAFQSVNLGLKANDIILDEVIAEGSKLLAIHENKTLIHQGLDIIHELHVKAPNPRYLDDARILFDRSKAILLNEKIKQHRLTAQMTLSDLESLKRMQFEMRELHGLKFKTALYKDSINGMILKLQEGMDGLYQKYQDKESILIVPENYMEYSVFDQDVYILSQLDHKYTFLKLGSRAELLSLIRRLHAYIELREWSEDHEILKDLYAFLVAPITNMLPGRVVIIPDGEIGYVPFEMLEDQNGDMLIRKSIITYAFDLRMTSQSQGKRGKDYEVYCLVPKYEEIANAEVAMSRGALGPLPWAKTEADSIQNLFGKDALISSVIDKDLILDNVRKSRIFHYTGHAIADKDQAYLAFSSEKDQDQYMTDQEVALMYESADLVVLSACETGLGKMEMGEGIRSLGRSFIESGATSTIISLWSVNDKSTAQIMAGFYRNLKKGLPKDEALRNAKLEYISIAGRSGRHPYFWAGFIPAGDMGRL